MNKIKVLISFIPVILLFAAANVTAEPDSLVQGQIVAKTNGALIPDSLLNQISGTIIDSIAGENTLLIEFPTSIPLEAVLSAFEISPAILYVEPNIQIKLPEVLQVSVSAPDENAPPLLLNTSPPNFYGQISDLNVGLDSAYILSTGKEILVAVVDNGIDLGHPLFAGALDSNRYDFVDDDMDPSETEGSAYGHGTFVSGLIKLVAPDSRILPIRSFNSDGIGTTFSAAKGIHWAIDNGADLINMSFGLETYTEVLSTACSTAVEIGLVLIASSGNNGLQQPIYPAALQNVIAVSAVDTVEFIADFSNYGTFLDLSAPGVNIYSSLAGDYEWGWWSGTSFSSAIVSGVAALVISRSGRFTPYDIQSHLQQSSRTELIWGSVYPPDIEYGYGIINAFSALLAIGRGDLNNSGSVDITDLTKYVDFIFRGGVLEANPFIVADFNCDTDVNLLDLTDIVDRIFRGGELFDPCY